MTNNGKICKNCGYQYFDWDLCCQEPLFNKNYKIKIKTTYEITLDLEEARALKRILGKMSLDELPDGEEDV